MRSQVEDRDHGAAAERVAPADFGDAVNAPSACPQAQDPAAAWTTAQVEFNQSAHVAVRGLDHPGVTGDPGDEESGHARLQATLARVLAQSLAERRRLDPSLKLADPPALALRLAMYRVLKALYELL
jgi:hypothetical protein